MSTKPEKSAEGDFIEIAVEIEGETVEASPETKQSPPEATESKRGPCGDGLERASENHNPRVPMFRIGDRVKLARLKPVGLDAQWETLTDSVAFPLWGGKSGFTAGVVKSSGWDSSNSWWYNVRWGTGKDTVFQTHATCLELIEESDSAPDSAPGKAFKVGDKVLITSLNGTGYMDLDNAPVWGGDYGHRGGVVKGHVMRRDGFWATQVKWDDCEFVPDVNFLNGQCLRLMNAEECILAADESAVRNQKKKEQAPEPEPEKRKTTWPAEAFKSREAWLQFAAGLVAVNPIDTAPGKVLFSCGYGKGGTRGARTWNVAESNGETRPQVFIRPSVYTKEHAVSAVCDALQSLGVAIRGAKDVSTWPAYPQPEAREDHTPSATRLLKCKCPACGFTFRSTSRWIDKAQNAGGMRCPMPNCHGVVTVG